jgi:hypothetical protein
MTAKEKATEFFNKLNEEIRSFEGVLLRGKGFEMTRRCALIAVDEILKTFDCTTPQSIEYWQEVKKEIQKL